MKTIVLLRHSLTEANERRLYCGWTDLPLSPAGEALAREMGSACDYTDFGLFLDTGLLRTAQTLALIAGRRADLSLAALREMRFGAFEMHSYDELKGRADYQRWIEDTAGDVRCPGGESRNDFRERVLLGAQALLERPEARILAVCHGGAIVQLMQAWFPASGRGFYDWQPTACHGYAVEFEQGTPVSWRPQ